MLKDAKLLIFGYCRQEKRRPETSLNYELVELEKIKSSDAFIQ